MTKGSRRRLLIIGAGGFGREVLWTAQVIPSETRDWEVGGFLDDNPEAAQQQLQQRGIQVPVLGPVSEYQPRRGDCFVCAVASPEQRLRLCAMLMERGAEFVRLIHPTALVAPSARLGVGVILQAYSLVSTNASVGDFVILNTFSEIGHDAVVEEGCTLSSHCDVTGNVRLERGVFLGSHASILPGVTVGEFAKVGAGSVVARRVLPRQTVMGVPAKVLVEP